MDDHHSASGKAASMRYPAAYRSDTVEVLHGQRVADPYRWLEDSRNADTARWCDAQESLYEAEQARWSSRRWFEDRIGPSRQSEWVTTPRWRGRRYFYLRRGPYEDHPVLAVADPEDGHRVLVGPSAAHPTGMVIEHWEPSPDGTLVAYQTFGDGTEECDLQVMDVGSGEIIDRLAGKIRGTSIAWLPGNRSFYYVADSMNSRDGQVGGYLNRKVWLHHVGAARDDDMPIFRGSRETDNYGVTVSHGRWLVIKVLGAGGRHRQVLLADLSASGPEDPRLVPLQGQFEGRSAVRFGRGQRADMIYLKTYMGSGRGRIRQATIGNAAAGSWDDLIPEDGEAVLEDFVIVDGGELAQPLLLVLRARHSVSEVTLHSLDDGALLGSVPLPGQGCVEEISTRPDGADEAWIAYSDPSRPRSIYTYDALTGELRPWGKPTRTARTVATFSVIYQSHDGTDVHMRVVAPTHAQPGVPRPTILTGYGGFGASLKPNYSSGIRAWVEAGGVYAVAGLRGGGEGGEAWHRAGMAENKQHAIADLHAAAEWLIKTGWSAPDGLGLFGGSHGGLIVGAAVIQRPDLYRAVFCATPLLDMIRYPKYGMGKLWTEEFGDPGVPHQLKWLLEYSPYHNVMPGAAYPTVLLFVAEDDTRVHPMHARKMAAALQFASESGRPILYHCENGIGHGNRRAVSKSADMGATMLSFFANELGLRPG